jgi:hypothetical protein
MEKQSFINEEGRIRNDRANLFNFSKASGKNI